MENSRGGTKKEDMNGRRAFGTQLADWLELSEQRAFRLFWALDTSGLA
jgi:hypothetical protein